MSQRSKAKQKSRQKDRARQKQKQKAVAGPPKVDPTRVKANLAQLGDVHRQASEGLALFKKEAENSFAQSHGNHQELLQGLNASEFNLRAHQKVINAMAADMEYIASLLTTMRKTPADPVVLASLKMVDVPIGPEIEGQLRPTVRRIDWPSYHTEVDVDLKKLAEMEKQRLEGEKKAAEAEKKRLLLERRKVLEAVTEGEQSVEAKEEVQPDLIEPPSNPETPNFPEGATIFGGV